MSQKIAVLDFGGQYAHLIASRVRRLGALAEIVDAETLTADAATRDYAGLIYSGGPESVYDSNAPKSTPDLLQTGLPILGICYGHQLIMQQLGGAVKPGSREFGRAKLTVLSEEGILQGEKGSSAFVWMSHGDEVTELPKNFNRIAETEDCKFAVVYNESLKITTLQFHPEVTHTEHGDEYLRNFIKLSKLENTYNIGDFLEREKKYLREFIGGRSVFFLLSGGVDSTVSFVLLSQVIPADRLVGLFVDTGFMRKNEGSAVASALASHGIKLHTADAKSEFMKALKGVTDPEKKRKIIGDLFLEIQARSVSEMKLDSEKWLLGQGTIYPDTIESGGTKKSHLIKTHHNRVPAIEKLIREGKVVEPIRDLYKDEVRSLGRLLGLPVELIQRHPFPGPGLAIRCLCSDSENSRFENMDEFDILPIKSVGVQGDQRTFAHPALLKIRNRQDALKLATEIPNKTRGVNRVLMMCGGEYPQRVHKSSLTEDRIELLRTADDLVTKFLTEKNIYDEIWQFPVVLLPLSRMNTKEECVILRPVVSADAMTVSPYLMKDEHLTELTRRLLAISGVGCVLFDLTTKPPGTIEWE